VIIIDNLTVSGLERVLTCNDLAVRENGSFHFKLVQELDRPWQECDRS
jgi:hypothetical protein